MIRASKDTSCHSYKQVHYLIKTRYKTATNETVDQREVRFKLWEEVSGQKAVASTVLAVNDMAEVWDQPLWGRPIATNMSSMRV